jgi:hypothetical protein
MTRCANCFRSSERAFCSLDCAIERWAVMLEGVELLDALMRLVDEAAEKRGAGRMAAQPAQPDKRSPRPKPPTVGAAPELNTPMFPAINGPHAPTGEVPNGFEAG